MNISYKTHIENEGWKVFVQDGVTSGTEGKCLRIEALVLQLLDKAGLDIRIEAQAHVQYQGWLPLKTDGEVIGTTGESLRLEALRIRLVGLDAKKYKIKYRVHVENIGWQQWKVDGETAGTTGVALRAEAIQIILEKIKEEVVVVVPNKPEDDPTQIIVPITSPDMAIPPEKILCASYSTHVENYGWGKEVTDGRLSGRCGQGLQLEAIRISLINFGALNLGVAYSTHVENVGWQPEVTNGQTAGTTDQGKRLEAIKIRLTGTDANKYSIWYRVHVQNEAWQEWCRDGDIAGTTGHALQAEAIQIIITLKSDSLIRTPGDAPLIAINYRSHIQNLAWAAWVKNGQKSGTTGLGLRMEALEINLSSLDGLDIGVKYRAHVQNIGWQPWVTNGKTAGTVGQGLRIEAVEISLTGADASKYKVQYRGHLENSGWTSWKTNGATLGTVGKELRLEAISIVLIKNVDLNANITNEVKNKAPIIQIWASDFPRSDVLLHDIRTEHKITQPKLTAGINKSSGFTFNIDPTHKYFNYLRKMHTVIYVYEVYSNTRKDLIFEGRITFDDEGLNKTKDVTCEGELGYLLDSTQRPAKYVNVTPEQWLTQVLDNHNMQVTADKRVHMGICTVLGDGTGVNISTNYRTHLENLSWQSWVRNGIVSGTTGSSLRMEALELKLENIGSLDIGVTYRAHVAGIGWQDWKVDGATAGTVNQSVRMEAIEIKLTGADAGLFSVQYRVHVQDDGWQDWKQDGETAGTTGQELRAEAISIIIVSKVDGTNGKLKDGLFRENEYVNTLELIKTTLLDTLGGVLVIERIGNIKFLNYLENYGSVNPQPIKFGLNMIDYSKITDASTVITALIPYGKEIDGNKLTIASVNNDCDYIYDEVAVAEYGWITDSHEWPDIDTPSALLYAAKLYLAGKVKQGISVELTAIDLSKINLDIQQFQVGDMVRCVSKPHNLDMFLSVSKKERDLQHPGNDQIVLGGVTQSLTDRISGPLGGGIMGFALSTANTVKNMEYVANELSFMVKITADTVTEQGTTINETKLEMTAFQISLSALETRTLETETAIDAAELKITPQAITSTVRSSVDYISDLNNKATVADLAGKADASALGSLTSRVSTAEQKITSTAIISTVTQSSTYTNAMTGKANKVTLISEINQSAEGIKISANKVDITGVVTFSNLSTPGQTVINGGNISGGTLNFANITATGKLSVVSDSVAGGLSLKTGSKIGDVYSNTSRGMTIKSNSGIYIVNTVGGYNITLDDPVTITGDLTAPNVVYTSSGGSERIYGMKYVPSYVEIITTAGAKGITIWDSDRRLKTNIKNSTINASNKLSQAVLRSFNWLKDGRLEQCGFVAQEIEAVFGEEFVLKVKQADGSVNYQIKEYPFIPLLIKAFQESNEKIMRLENEVSLQKHQIKELKGETIC